jgi:hypothetical protein
VHLLTATSQWGYTPMHKDTVGGALGLTHKVYLAVGGYSNQFWGWGGEDNNMYTRLEKGPGVRRPALGVGRYHALFHPRVMGLDETDQFKNNHKIIHKQHSSENADGISNVKYKTLETRHRQACGDSASSNGNTAAGAEGANRNSVIIHTIQVLNTENLHPASKEEVGAVPESNPAPPDAAGSNPIAEPVFEVVQNADCEGGDIRQHPCVKRGDACVESLHRECYATVRCFRGWTTKFAAPPCYCDHTPLLRMKHCHACNQ